MRHSNLPERPDQGESIERIREHIATMNAVIQTAQSERDRSAAERETEANRLAQAARRGDLGPDWKRIQQRIDLNQTSVSDVFGGEDQSAEAERLRAQSRRRIAELHTELREQAEAGEAEDNPFLAMTNLAERQAGILGALRMQLDTHRGFDEGNDHA